MLAASRRSDSVMMLRRVQRVALVALCLLTAGASSASTLHFDQIDSADGLVQNSVSAVLQDEQGYIWLGTEDGLHRWDGYRMEVFQNRPGDETTLRENFISTMELSADGRIWVATYSGLDRLDPITGRFERIGDQPDGISSPYIYALEETEEGTLWIATADGLDRYDPASGEFEHFNTGAEAESHRLPDDTVWTVYEDHAGRVWVGTNQGLVYYDPEQDRIVSYRSVYEAVHGEFEELPVVEADRTLTAEERREYFIEGLWTASINTLHEDSFGRLWVGTQSGIALLDDQRDLLQTFVSPRAEDAEEGDLTTGAVFDITEDHEGSIWVGTYGGGLFRYVEETGRFDNQKHDPTFDQSLANDRIYTLFVDRSGLLWIGTEAGGANTFDPSTRAYHHFRHARDDESSLASPMVWAFEQAPDGALWVGTEKGISILDRSTGAFTHLRNDPDEDLDPEQNVWEGSLTYDWVNVIYRSPDDEMWVGHQYGLSWHLGDGRFKNFYFDLADDDPSLYVPEAEMNLVTSLIQQGDRMFVGTARGLIILDPETGDWTRMLPPDEDPENGLPGNQITILKRALDGQIWVGLDQGLLKLDPDTLTWRHYPGGGVPGETLTDEWVNDVLVREDAVWIATSYGIDRLDRDTDRISNISMDEGLPNNTVYALVEDDRNHIWASTNKGLVDYDPTSGEMRIYDANDGLQDDEFNGGADGRLSDGHLVFGGIDGFNLFHPAEIRPNRNRPTVAITEFYLFNEPLHLGVPTLQAEEIELDHTDSVIGFEFIAFDFAAPSRNRFRFKLEGFDSDWRSDEDRNRASYTNLDPGSYTFRVRGANKDGIWSENDATLSLVIHPPWWETWWAYLTYVLLTAGLITGFFHQQRRRILRANEFKHEQQRRHWAETMHKLTQSMAATLDAHEISEQLLSNLQRMVPFDQAVLFVEQGTETELVATTGVSEAARARLELLPETHAQRFANLRHSRRPMHIGGDTLVDTPLSVAAGGSPYWFVVPMFSRAEEFALLMVGRHQEEFSDQEMDIASAFAKQAMVSLENAKLFAEVQNLATTDSLTRLHNRRYFLELAELEFTRSRRYHRELSVILLDADHFKQVNDNYGHEVGDRVLKIVANICRTNLRHFDVVGRYGGEEFIILLPETGAGVAADVADRIRMSIENVAVSTHKGELKVTVSMGIAALSEQTDLAALINDADSALYRSKHGGRNQVQVFSPGDGT